MPLQQVALYLESADPSGVAALLGPVFAQQCEAVGRGSAELRLLALEGWVAALGVEALDGRAILAEGLSRELGGAAAALELTGAAFRWTFVPFRAGTASAAAAGFDARPAPAEPMPLYPDAEVDAYRALLGLGVPPWLAIVTPDPEGDETRPEIRLRWDGRGLVTETTEARVRGHPEADPPVVLGPRLGPTPRGMAHLEPRAVAGLATAEAVRRLAELETAYRARVQASRPGEALDIRFAYRRASGETLDLAAALRPAGGGLLSRLTRGKPPA